MIEVIVNPAGASGRTIHAWEQAQKVFQKAHAECRVHFSDAHQSIENLANACTEDGGTLVVVGGDGTFNHVINGIRDFSNVRIGFIPCGSGNDLSRALKIERDPVHCAEQILKDETRRRLDIGQVVYHNSCQKEGDALDEKEFSRLFNISCGIGFDAAICHEVGISRWKPVLNKIHMGKSVYAVVALKLLVTTKMCRETIVCDGKKTTYPEALLTVGMNEPYEGGGFRFCPDAEGDDGCLNLCTGDSLGYADILRILPYAYFGQHVRFQGVHLDRFHEAEIMTDRPLWVHQDGETEAMSSHITIRLYDQKLMMLN